MATGPDNGDEQSDSSEGADAVDDADTVADVESTNDAETTDHTDTTEAAETTDHADTGGTTTSVGETGDATGDAGMGVTTAGAGTDDATVSATTADEPSRRAGGVDYEVSDDEQTWGVLVHVSALAGMFVPFGNVLGPLLVWLVKRDESRFVDENGIEALNFQITWTILFVVALASILVAVGIVLVPLVALAWLVLVVIATIRASEHQVYDYPLTYDFVS